jgi:hypothetical protein
VNAQLAHMADMLRKPPTEGYVAERHGLQPEFVIIWAPCGCYWIGNAGGSFVTCCMKDCCDYSNLEAERALRALQQAEEALQGPAEQPKPQPKPVESPDEAVEASSETVESSEETSAEPLPEVPQDTQ